MGTIDKVWLICRLVLGILSIVLSLAVFLLETFIVLVGSYSMNGPDGSEGNGYIFVLIFLVTGVLAIIFNIIKMEKGPAICAGIYGLGFLIAAYIYSKYDFISVKQSMSLYGLICLVLAVIFLFSVCRTRKAVLISAAVILALIGTGVLVMHIQKEAGRIKQQEMVGKKRIYGEKMLQEFRDRTPEKTALDHLTYFPGMSKEELIIRLEVLDGMSHYAAQKLADSLDVDWGLHALYRACPMVVMETRYDEASGTTIHTIVQKDEENIRKKLSEQGFSEKEIGYAIQNLEEDHLADFGTVLDVSKYYHELVCSDLDKELYQQYYDGIIKDRDPDSQGGEYSHEKE